MEASPQLVQFLEHLHTLDNQEPELSFPARTVCSDTLPRLFNTLPDGDIHLFPGYVVFLTLTDGAPGARQLWKQFAREVGDQIKQVQLAYKAATDPGGLLLDAAKWLIKQFKDEDLFAQAIMNPNSLFIPREDILAVETGCSWSQGNHIQIATRQGTIQICQNIAGNSDTLVDIARVGYSMFKKSWQPEFVSRLQQQLTTPLPQTRAG